MLAGTAASAGASAAQYSAQSQNANAAAKFQNQRYSSTASIAMENYLRTIGQTQLQLQQNTAASAQQALANHLTSQAARANAVTSAAESGVQGNSVAELLNQFAQHEAYNNGVLHTQLQWEQMQADENLRSARTQAMGNVASATPAPVQGPSSLALGLQMGSLALSGLTQTINQQRSHDPYANFPSKGS
jgi:hypothetical protein